jgi:hypothetical protein
MFHICQKLILGFCIAPPSLEEACARQAVQKSSGPGSFMPADLVQRSYIEVKSLKRARISEVSWQELHRHRQLPVGLLGVFILASLPSPRTS